MKKSGKIAKKDRSTSVSFEEMFEQFRKEMAAMMHLGPEIGLGGIRVPVCDIADRGSKYELHVEVPGIDKDKIEVKATPNLIEISGKNVEGSESKVEGYYYNERSAKSFYRSIPVPEEIDASKVEASMNNGILTVDLPKATSKRAAPRKVQVK